jgi:DNA gyrase subunit A
VLKRYPLPEKTGNLVAIKSVTDADDLMIINRSGVAIRISVEDLRVMGRAAQGVKVINLRADDEIAAVAKVVKEEDVVDEDEIRDINVDESNNSTDESIGYTSEEN